MINVLYDFSNQVTKEYSLDIIKRLAKEGLLFEINQSKDNQVYLVIDGRMFTPFDIEEDSDKIIDFAKKADLESRIEVHCQR